MNILIYIHIYTVFFSYIFIYFFISYIYTYRRGKHLMNNQHLIHQAESSEIENTQQLEMWKVS